MLLYDEGATAEQIRDHGRALVLWSIQTRADDGVTVTSMLLPLKSLSQAFGSSAESLFLVGDNGDKLLQVSFPVNAPPTLGPPTLRLLYEPVTGAAGFRADTASWSVWGEQTGGDFMSGFFYAAEQYTSGQSIVEITEDPKNDADGLDFTHKKSLEDIRNEVSALGVIRGELPGSADFIFVHHRSWPS